MWDFMTGGQSHQQADMSTPQVPQKHGDHEGKPDVHEDST